MRWGGEVVGRRLGRQAGRAREAAGRCYEDEAGGRRRQAKMTR
jgi:hypothetical protein